MHMSADAYVRIRERSKEFFPRPYLSFAPMPYRKTIFLLLALAFMASSLFGQRNQPLATLTGADTIRYSREYIEELRSSGMASSISLVDSMMVVDGLTVFFPTDLKLDQWYVFSASTAKEMIELRVKRINYTNIQYEFWIGNEDKRNEDEGMVIGGPDILGSEIDEDDLSGVAYTATEYSNCSLHCCRSIRIGRNDADELVAKYTRHCDLPGRDIDLYDLPTLRLQKE